MNRLLSCRRVVRAPRGAFTLLEVLLVLAILAILASLAYFAFRDTLFRSNVKAAKLQIDALKGPLSEYQFHYNRYPATLEELWTPADTSDPSRAGRYLEKPIPLDPWGNAYQYEPPANPLDDYRLWSYGPDGQNGTDDDIGSWQ
jgi:general secretion pathway protein G